MSSVAAEPGPGASGAVFAPWAASWRWVLALTLAVTGLRVLYLALWCPYALIEDEAQYWVWSLHPDWAYSTKGPGVAWVIGLSTAIFGNEPWAVRLPAALSIGVAGLAVAALAREATGEPRAGFFAAACLHLAPVFQALGLLMTIDGPYVACWALACWAAWRALRGGGPGWWALLGAALAAGFLFKFTIVLLAAGLVLGGLAARRAGWVGAPGRWWALAGAIFALGLLPPIVWNAEHGWPTVAHLLGHAGLPGGDQPGAEGAGGGVSLVWPLVLIGTQAALVGPVLALMWAGWRLSSAAERGGLRVLAAFSAPVLVFYFVLSFMAEPEGNWPIAGWVGLMPLAGLGVARGMDDFVSRVRAWRALPEPRPKAGVLTRRPETGAQVAWHAALGVGLVVCLAGLRLDVLLALPGVRDVVPRGRLTSLTGPPVMAAHVRRLADGVRLETGLEPFIVAQHYGRAAQLWYELARGGWEGARVYCASPMLGGRTTPWDYWEQTRLDDPGLMGRPAVISADEAASETHRLLAQAFRTIEPVGRLEGDGKRGREAFVGRDYSGFAWHRRRDREDRR